MCWRSIGISWTRCGSSCSRSFTLSESDQENFCMNSNSQTLADNVVQVPAPTGWPLVAAFGFTLIFAGLLTHLMVSILGAFALYAGVIGWFRQVLPHEAHEEVKVE